jgi:hypothetical protein
MKIDLDRIFESDIHVKIIKFFHENQSSIDTPRGIATWIGYKRDDAEKALSELSGCGILNAHPASSTTGYSYTHDEKIIRAVTKHLKRLK